MTAWHCPSPDCPHRRKHGRAADYTTQRESCTDCGTALVEGEGPTPTRRAQVPGSLYSRVAVTLALPVLVWAIGRLPLPLGSAFGESLPGELLLVRDATFGLTPIVTGFILIEVLALIVPRWRSLRVSGPDGRRRLDRWSYTIGGVAALVQVWGLLTYLESMGMLYGTGEKLLFAVGSLAWTFGLVGLAHVIRRWGVANGFAVLLSAEFVPGLFATESAPMAPSGPQPTALVPYLVVAALCIGIGFLVEYRRANPRAGTLWAQTPLSGLVPVSVMSALLVLPFTLANYGWDLDALLDALTPGTTAYAATSALVVAILTVPFAFLFHAPSRVSALVSEAGSQAQTKRWLWKALPWTLLFTVSVAVVPTLVAAELSLPFYISGYSLAFLVAVSLDSYHECRARLRHPDLISVWPEPRLYAVGVLMSALEEAGVPAHARATRYRALLQFFGPYVPVEIMVSPSDAARAGEVIEDRLLAAEGVPGKSTE